MTPYLILFTIILLNFTLLEFTNLKKILNLNLNLFFFIFIPLLFFSLLYSGIIGSDVENYKYQFKNLNNIIINPGFYLFMKLSKTIGLDFYGFSILLSIINLFLIMKITKKVNDPFLFFIIYFSIYYLNFHFNIVRNSLSVLLLGYLYVSNTNLSINKAIIPSLIHYSAPIAFLLFKLNSINLNKKDFIKLVNISIFFILIFFVYKFRGEDLLDRLYDYLNLNLKKQDLYPLLIVKLILIYFFTKNGLSKKYFYIYCFFVFLVHFASPFFNRFAEIIFFSILLITFKNFTILKFRNLVIIFSIICIISSLLIPYRSCYNIVDNWCI